jgi:hypothetical protein
MTTDTWLDQEDNWDTPSDRSAGLPGPSSDVVLGADEGAPIVTASFRAVASIRINKEGSLAFIDAGASSVAGGVTIGHEGTNCGLELDYGGQGGVVANRRRSLKAETPGFAGAEARGLDTRRECLAVKTRSRSAAQRRSARTRLRR